MRELLTKRQRPHRGRGFMFVRGQAGLSLLEMIIAITVTAIIAGVMGKLLSTGVDTYDFVSSRKDALQDTRMATQRMCREIREITSPDSIMVATPDSIRFFKMGGQSVTIARSGSNLNLNGYALANNVTGFLFSYYDDQKNLLQAPVSNPSNIWQIKFELTIQVKDHEIRLFNEIKPRNF